MKLEVFEKSTGLRLGLIKTYDFIQYTDVFNGVGDFMLNIPYTEESFPILVRGNYILFDEEDMGIIEYRNKSIDNESIIVIKGHLLNKMLNYRTFEKTYTIKGTLESVCNSIITDKFINPKDPRRKIPFITLSDTPIEGDSQIVTFQKTGGAVGDSISELVSADYCGYKLKPVISNYDEGTENPSNISSMEFNILRPVDRTQENTEGRTPVTFSLELNNLQRLEYTEDASDYCSVVYVAGEGEGVNRKVVETGSLDLSGLDRIELYVDARDLTREDVDTGETLTEEEYNRVLKSRGDSRLEDRKIFESFSGQIVDGEMSYTYRKDFFNGDFVTLVDTQLNVSVTAQITHIEHSATQNGEKLDIQFGYKKESVRQLLKKRSVI